MKKHASMFQRLLSLMTAIALVLSFGMVTVSAAEVDTSRRGTVVNTSGDGGEDYIQLVTARSFKGMVPVNMTLEEAKETASQVTWSLLPDDSKEYLNPELFPNQTEGGPLSDWVCNDGKTSFFTDIVSGAETVDGQVYLTVTFSSVCYFGSDTSAPHIKGGAYLDVCGYFNLTAVSNGKTLGAAPVKITPYDNFHTMAEIYDEIDEIVAFAAENTDLYVERFSMGMSSGDNGLESLDMPYLIVAKDKTAVSKWLSIKAEAESDPAGLIAKIENGTLTDYQVPVMYSNIHPNEVSATDSMLVFTWMLLKAAAGEGAIDYNVLTGFTAEGEAELALEMGEAGAAGSVAVPDLVKDSATYLGYLRGDNSVSGVVDLEKYYTIETETVDVDDLLDDVFFIIVPEENVEGRTYLTRESSNGFDLNRDNSFQTQAETQNMTQLIAAWNPVSFTEFHGRVKAFQCEPCDPPHEPNFEYDLLAEHLMGGGEALGIAAVANNDGYNSYVIPQRDYLSYTGEKTADGEDETCWYDPWDDMSTSYTPQYAMLHGTVAYTVELPAYNDDTATAAAYGQLGQSVYVASNKEGYLLAQTKIFERGVTNANSDAYELVGQWFCDVYDVEGAEAELFRPEYNGEGQNGNFYPECYIIPLDGVNQTNLQAADEMITYLVRNGVTVNYLGEAVTYDGVEYPAGTAIVSMYQAKRSVANGVLYDGTVITGWPVLYSEGITAFNLTRGFDMVVCAEPAAYQTIAAAFGDASDWTVTSYFSGITGQLAVISNASEDSTAAVNALLQAGKEVGMIISGDYKGDFICSYADYQSVADDYLITGTGVSKTDAPLSLEITQAPVVYNSGKPADNTVGFVKTTLVGSSYQYNYDREALALMGFQVTEDASEATLVVGGAALDQAALAAVKSGTAYIGYGSTAINSVISNLFTQGELVREAVSRSSMDALAYVTYPTETLVNASYIMDGDDVLYGYGAGYFAAIPDGAKVLVQLDGSKELIEGFLVGTGDHYDDFLDDSIQAISYQENGLNMVLFANTLTNKVHQRDEYAYISNMAFSSLLGDVLTGSVKTTEDAQALADAKFTDVSATSWYAEAVGQVVDQELFLGTPDGTFEPYTTATRGMMVTVLHRLAGLPESTVSSGFADVASSAWYASAVDWAAETGVTFGTSTETFTPGGVVTREELVSMLYRYAQNVGADVSGADLSGYPDAASVSGFAKEAMAWAVKNGIILGTDKGTLAPKTPANRADLAVIMVRAAALLDD